MKLFIDVCISGFAFVGTMLLGILMILLFFLPLLLLTEFGFLWALMLYVPIAPMCAVLARSAAYLFTKWS